jgi:hypothetical protein
MRVIAERLVHPLPRRQACRSGVLGLESNVMKQGSNCYPLTELQHGMLLHSLVSPGDGVYVVTLVLTIREALDVQAFTRAWQYLVDWNPVLRTTFSCDPPDRPTQTVLDKVAVAIDVQDWRSLAPHSRQIRLDTLIAAEKRRSFAFAHAPPMQLTRLRMRDAEFAFIWSSHHAQMDGRSYLSLLCDLFQVYTALVAGATARPVERRPYADFVAWLASQERAGAEAFWREYLAGLHAPPPPRAGSVPAAP